MRTSLSARPGAYRRLLLALTVPFVLALTLAGCAQREDKQVAAPRAGPTPTASPATTSSPVSKPSPSTRPGVGTWQRLPTAPIAARRGSPMSVWTGTEMLIYGSYATSDEPSSRAGAAYEPATGTWRKLPPVPATGPSESHNTAVWTGTEMMVHGLVDAAFNPATNRWRSLPDAPDGAPGGASVMVWTGRQAIVWGGGCCGGYDSSGAAYTPATNSWQVLPKAPLTGRHTAGAWTGKELILAGGEDADGGIFRDAAAYNPAARSWRRLPPLPGPRTNATAVWDGNEVLVVGGHRSRGSLRAEGFAYDPSANRWRRMPAMEFGRAGHQAVWTGGQLLIWGGVTVHDGHTVTPPHGVAYDPANNRWSALPRSPLRGRVNAAAIWTGTEMVIWGGNRQSAGVGDFADGATYIPSAG